MPKKKTMPKNSKVGDAALKKTYKGKSTAPGMGGHFQMVVDALMKEGKTEEQAKAIAATQGREKYGKEEFQKMAAKGRKRAARKKSN